MSKIDFTYFPSLREFADDQWVAARAALYIFLSVFALFTYFLTASILNVSGVLPLPGILWMFSVLGVLWTLLILGMIGVLGAEFMVALFLTSLFLQNALIATVTTYDPDTQAAFSIMVGTNFFITCLFSATCALMWVKNRRLWAPENRELLNWIVVFSLLVIAYSGLGLASSDLKSVVAYARAYLGAVMFFVIGVQSGHKISTSFLVGVVRVLAVILVVWGAFELLFQKELLEACGALDYTRMKYMGAPSITSLKELLEGQTYFNFSGKFGLDFEMPRLRGTNIHPISYAYELAFCCLICFMYRARILAAACFIILLFVGAKGATVLTLMSLLFYILYAAIGRPRLVLSALAVFVVFYVSLVIYYGVISEDFHVIGLVGSLRGFFEKPWGHGVGVGGNLSTEGMIESGAKDFERYQHQGATDIALESGFGVMLYQFGVAAALFFGFYGCVFKSVWSKITAPGIEARKIVLPVAMVFVLVNSVFQEEAFSPACLGLWLMFGGFFIAKRWQDRAAH